MSHARSAPKAAAASVWNTSTPGDERDDGEAGDEEDRIVDIKAKELDVVLTQLVVNLRDLSHRVSSAMQQHRRSAATTAVRGDVRIRPLSRC